MIACENSGRSVNECFPDVRKTSSMPKGDTKLIIDYELTRYACYLIVQNRDSRKEVLALGQTYFVILKLFYLNKLTYINYVLQ